MVFSYFDRVVSGANIGHNHYRSYRWDFVTDKSINLWGLVKKQMDESMQVESVNGTPGNPLPPPARTS